MRFEPIEKQNDKDNSIKFYMRSSLIPVAANLLITACMGFMTLYFDDSTRLSRTLDLLFTGFWALAFVAFSRAVVARISTLIFVTKYRLYGQVYGFLPSHRQIEISLLEIKDLEVRATFGTKLFHYAHLIVHPYNGKKVKLPFIRNAEANAIIILKMQEKLQKEEAGKKPVS
ncbi:MAG: hypothetical protein J5752_04870 [Clostridiales bacterium]|nr:hypothetical protein [Clostridiales bacterium]